MAEIVNLNKVRKRRDRAAQEAQAATNRAKHGRTRGERAREDKEAEARAQVLAGARLEEPAGE